MLDGVDVGRQGERHNVGRKALDHGARLGPRAAVRLLDDDVVAGLLLPVPGEGGVVIDVEFAGRIIRHVEQLDGLCLGGRRQGEGE